MACVTVNNSVCVFLVFTLCFFIVVCDDCPTACRCFTLDTGGQKVQCSLLGIKTLRLDKLPKATVELNLAYNQIKVIRKDSFPVSRKLKRLDLKGNQIQHIEPGAFKKFPRLTKLYLQVNKLTKIDKNTFRGLRNLKHLNISQNSLLYIHQQAFHGLKNLKRISLKKNKLTTLPKSTFSNSSKIELDDNDLICDCDMSWLVAITKEKRRGVSDNSKCKYPTLLAGKKIRYLATKNWNCRNAAFELPKFQTSPTENQIVFQNDSLELTCTSIWQPRGRITWQIHPASVRDVTIRDYSDVNSRENKTVLSIKKIDVHHSGVYTCKAHVNEVNQVVKSVEVTVIGWQTEFCPKQAKATSKGTFVWQSTAPGGHVQYACPFGTDLRASRNCSARGVWQTADLSKCHEKNILTRKISILKKRNINSTSIQSTINTFLNITRTHKDTFSNIQQLQLLAEVFSSVCSAKFPIASDSSKLIKSSVSAMLTSMLLINVSLYKEDPLKDNSTSKLIKSFEELLADYLNREIKQSPKNVPVIVPVTSSVAGYSRSYRPKYPHGLVCTVLFKDHQDKSNSGFGECGISINGTKTLEGFNAQVIIPKMFFALSSSSIFDDPRQLTKVSFIAYKTAELFRDHKFTKIQSTTPETMISSAVVGIHVEVPGIGSTSLVTNDNVVFKFRKRRVGSKPRLIYWATKITKTGTRNWWKLSKHCRLLSETSSYVRFACSELPGKMTYFSVIMDIARKEKPVASFRLEIVTHFGAALCSVFLLMTLATYAFFRELRYNRNDAATLMNLCLALTVAVIIFVVGITRTENKLLCKSFAVLLHYFLLCGLLWLGCGGACLTSLIKKGPDNEEYSPVLKYYLISWGLPIIVCGITLAGNSNNYSTSNYCWLTSRASIGAFVVPGGLVIITNMIVFLRLHALINRRFPEASEHTRKLAALQHNSKDADGKVKFHFPDRSQLLDFIKGSLTVMLILCIDCGFVVMIFTNKNGPSRYLYYIFSYGFAISNILLGMAVFVFHCVRREDVYACWKAYLLSKSRKFNLQETNAVEMHALMNQTDSNAGVTLTNVRASVVHSENAREHSDVISHFSASVFTHDVQSSRPSSVFGHSCPPVANSNRMAGPGKLTLPTFESKTSPRKQSEASAIEPSAPSLPVDNNPLAGFAAYPQPAMPETVTCLNEKSPVFCNATCNATVPTVFTLNDATIANFAEPAQDQETKVAAAFSEKTFSDLGNSTAAGEARHHHHGPLEGDAVARETIMSECGSVPSHMDHSVSQCVAPALPLRNFVAPNWKPVRSGGSTAVFYPYVDPGYKLMQPPPAQNSADPIPVAATGPSQVQAVIRPEPLNPVNSMIPAGAFTIPQRTEAAACVVGGITNSNQAPSVGNHTDQHTDVDQQTKKQAAEVTEAKEKPAQAKKPRHPRNKRRHRSRTRFEDIPVEKCIVYVPLPQVSPNEPKIGNETSV